VFVGSDDKKRLQWPLAKVVELIPGRDGLVRVAKLKTQHGVLVRPLQRLYPLEVSSAEEVCRAAVTDSGIDSGVMTRSGRVVTRPKRLTE